MEVLVTVVACLLVFLVLWRLSGTGGKKPPGPWGVPILGYIPFLTKKPYLELQRLAKKYGNVFSIRLGSHYVVVLNDYQSAKETFAQDAYMGRPMEFSFPMTEYNKKFKVFHGMPWREQRRFSLHALRDLGLGKSKMEAHMQEEINELLECFEKTAGKPFSIRVLAAASTSNNIAALVFGRRFKDGDPLRKMLTKAVNDTTTAAGQVSLVLFLPWLKKITETLGLGSSVGVLKATKILRGFIKKEIEEHEKTLDPENIRDFIDGYLLEMQKRKDDPTFHKDVLEDIVAAFFGAGSETVRLSIEWLVIMMGHCPDAQRRIQAEIDEAIGRDRPPIWPDHKNMPYTDAFMKEAQRWKTLVPLNIMRYTLADTEVNGYFIPKHTQVLHNLWAVHHDKEYWGEDAEEFRPDRFLTEDGKAVKKWDHFIPFSIGKRACPGEPLAKIETFLYFASIMQKFDIRFPDGQVANFDSDLGISLTPKPQEVIMTKRS